MSYTIRRLNGMQQGISLSQGYPPENVVRYDFDQTNHDDVVRFVIMSGWNVRSPSSEVIEAFLPGKEHDLVRVYPGDIVVRYRNDERSASSLASRQMANELGYRQDDTSGTAMSHEVFATLNSLSGELDDALSLLTEKTCKKAAEDDREAFEEERSALVKKLAILLTRLH